jgi:hypothetical protein
MKIFNRISSGFTAPFCEVMRQGVFGPKVFVLKSAEWQSFVNKYGVVVTVATIKVITNEKYSFSLFLSSWPTSQRTIKDHICEHKTDGKMILEKFFSASC